MAVMAPPRDEDEERRDDMVLIRVNREEKRLLTEGARYEGLSVSSWLRQLGLRAARKTAAGR